MVLKTQLTVSFQPVHKQRNDFAMDAKTEHPVIKEECGV
jgi:hypothetical protein